MDLTLGQHIERLEQTVKKLNQDIMEERTLEQRNRIEAEIRAAELALAHYRAAYDLELKLARGRT